MDTNIPSYKSCKKQSIVKIWTYIPSIIRGEHRQINSAMASLIKLGYFQRIYSEVSPPPGLIPGKDNKTKQKIKPQKKVKTTRSKSIERLRNFID